VTAVITVNGLAKHYKSVTALDGVTFAVKDGCKSTIATTVAVITNRHPATGIPVVATSCDIRTPSRFL